MRKTLAIAAAALLPLGFTVACGDDDDEDTPTEDTGGGAEVPTDTGAMVPEGS